MNNHLKYRRQQKVTLWKPDKATYDTIQKIKSFIDFIVSLPMATEEQKTISQEIKTFIENIGDSENVKNWCVCLDIFDNDIQEGIKDEGFYWRNWSIYYENNCLDITAESNHTADNYGHYGDDYSYYSTVSFREDFEGKRTPLDPIDDFIADAKNYEKYITETLKKIEIDIAFG